MVESVCLKVQASQGLSSLLLQIAVGVSSDVGEAEDDYVIERELGRGQFGIVVQVCRERSDRMPAPQRFALKLHSGTTTEAELLATIDHPFCVRVLHHFQMWPGRTFLYEDGSEVGNFSSAIMMELCSHGTLETELAKYWCAHSSPQMPQRAALRQEEPLKTDCLQRLRLWQRLGAELAEVMKCLHEQNPPIVYRDLKPDNVLMKEGRDGQLHVCLTDFGWAKQPNFAQEMATPAGNFLTAAPEVPRPWQDRKQYTMYVDNWSLGKTLLCMLWCTYGEYNGRRYPVEPEAHLWEDENDPRVPSHAAKLIKTLTDKEPLRRGTMRQACRHPFFTAPFIHMGEEFQPVHMQALLDDARL
jgi:serine/threonine protein kinase